jgi:transposase-like protein
MAQKSVPHTELVNNLAAFVADAELRELRDILALVLDRAMQLEVAERVVADFYERSESRKGYRNGTRSRRFDTRLGTIDLAIPKLRARGYMPSFLERRSRSERALIAVMQEAVLAGVSTRKVAKLFRALGIKSISKSQASELCAEFDNKANAFRPRPLTKRYPYLMLVPSTRKCAYSRPWSPRPSW